MQCLEIRNATVLLGVDLFRIQILLHEKLKCLEMVLDLGVIGYVHRRLAVLAQAIRLDLFNYLSLIVQYHLREGS